MSESAETALTIGSLAREAGVSVETIRYYQREGLLVEPSRKRGAYRIYGPTELARLRAIRRAQELGFSLAEINALLLLNEDTDRDRARALANAKITLIDSRIRQLESMRGALRELVSCCERGDSDKACPILRALSSP